MPSYPAYYRDAFDPAKNRTKMLAEEGKYFFAQDMNEGFSAERHARSGIADALFRDGQVVRAAQIAVNSVTGVTTLEAGQVYIKGQMRDLLAATLTLPVAGEVLVGVVIETRVITAEDDPALKFQNFPTKSFKTHGQPRQSWIEETPRWGSSAEARADTPTVAYNFYPVYTVRDGVVVVHTQPDTPVYTAAGLIERYDRESNGHYIARGCGLTYLETVDGAQVFSLAEGTVNVDGRKIDRPSSERLTYVEDPDLERINAEPHIYADGGTGTHTITLNRTPVKTIHDVSILVEKTVTVTRGQSSGGRDPLPDAQIQEIITAKQGGTTYAKTVSWYQNGDEIDWSPGGAEPSPGSTYQVTYRYKHSITPDAITATSVTVSGAVTGSEVDVDYSWMMPRYDIVCIDRYGAVNRVKGVASAYNPQRPRVPDALLEIAEVEQRWSTGYPIVRETGVQSIPKSTIKAIRDAVVENRQELARVRLESSAQARNPAAMNGIFVDNFDNDAQRDGGLAQTASVVAGNLMLSITPQIVDITLDGPQTLAYAVTDAITQPLITRGHPINPYQSFAPVPAQLTLSPSTDEWTQVDSMWASPITETIQFGVLFGWEGMFTGTRVTEEVLSSSQREAAFIRVRNVSFSIKGFGPGEQLQSLTFDALDVTPLPKPSADGAGVIAGSFEIPEGVPAGTKSVVAVGAAGSAASATYTGRGVITTEERRARISTGHLDPVYQSIVPSEGMHMREWAFRLTSIGNPAEPIIVQLRDAVRGEPGTMVLDQAVIDMHTVNTVSDVVARFASLPWLTAGTEYTVVWLTNDPDHAIAVAELGKFDQISQRWVTAQPYQIGVFGSSSNNVAWTIHQELDAYFKARRASFAPTSRTIDLGTVTATDVTDILVLAGVETPTVGCSVEFEFYRPNGKVFRLPPGGSVSLDTKLNEVLTVKAVLRGTATASPILYPDIQIVLGKLQDNGTYISRAMVCGANRTIVTETRAALPGAATMALHIQQTNGTWTAIPQESVADDGDGYRIYKHKLTAFSAVTTRLRVTLTGTPAARPAVDTLVCMPLTV